MLIFSACLAADLIIEVINRCGEETAGAAGGVEHTLAFCESRIDLGHHELGDCTRSIEFTRIPRAPQITQYLLVYVTQLRPILEVMKINCLFELLDDREH